MLCKHNFYMHWETKIFVWLTLLKYLLYWGGQGPNLQYLCGLSVSLCIQFIESDMTKVTEQSTYIYTHTYIYMLLLLLLSCFSYRQHPTRLPHPWDSPGKNTGVDCHFLLQCMKVKSESEVAQSCPTLSDLMDWSLPRCSVHGILQARILEWGAICTYMYVCMYVCI